jgi:hypothetical protein
VVGRKEEEKREKEGKGGKERKVKLFFHAQKV